MHKGFPLACSSLIQQMREDVEHYHLQSRVFAVSNTHYNEEGWSRFLPGGCCWFSERVRGCTCATNSYHVFTFWLRTRIVFMRSAFFSASSTPPVSALICRWHVCFCANTLFRFSCWCVVVHTCVILNKRRHIPGSKVGLTAARGWRRLA